LVADSFLLPRQYRVERSIVINAPREKVYPHLADLKAWKNWTVWNQRDPGMKIKYSEQSAVVGAWSEWESEKEGSGKATLTQLEQNRLVYALEFPEFEMKSSGSFVLQPEGQQVRVIWADEGDLGNNPMSRRFGLFLDGMLGKDFEAGLANLKKVTET
jgi:hypothetical protein